MKLTYLYPFSLMSHYLILMLSHVSWFFQVNYTQLFFWIERHDRSIHTVYALGVQQLYTAGIPLLEAQKSQRNVFSQTRKNQSRYVETSYGVCTCAWDAATQKFNHHDYSPIREVVNPRCACAARVTVLGLCVCVSVP